MDYEMRLPMGTGEKIIADVVDKYEVRLKHTDYGPIFLGKKEVLEEVNEYIIKELNERIKGFQS
ncbi:MAG: hypothetical protein ACRC1M_01665 [Methanobacteriaceae archaeon]